MVGSQELQWRAGNSQVDAEAGQAGKRMGSSCPMDRNLTRREMIAVGAIGIAGMAARGGAVPAADRGRKVMSLSLNSSVIRPAPLERKVRIAAEMGYDGIELWDEELERYQGEGYSLTDLGRRIQDLGLFVPNIIGLWDCMPPDESRRSEAVEIAKRRMERGVAVGARCIAAIPAPDREDIGIEWAAERYRELLEVGRGIGIRVAVEFVGSLRGVHRLGMATAIAIEADDPDACLVCDTFHLYRGGSGFRGIRQVRGSFLAVCHFNDVPAFPPQERLEDADRIMPGDGILPLVRFVRDLWDIGFTGPLSLETFNRGHWSRDPRSVAREGIRKTRAVLDVARADWHVPAAAGPARPCPK